MKIEKVAEVFKIAQHGEFKRNPDGIWRRCRTEKLCGDFQQELEAAYQKLKEKEAGKAPH